MAEAITLTTELASRLAAQSLASITREYPNAPQYVLQGPQDLLSPKRIHPAFYGAFDWHSAVHGHWALVRLLRRQALPQERAIRAALAEHLADRNLELEAAYLASHPTFERPYGWAWLIKLARELETWDDSDGCRWFAAISPLRDSIAHRLLAYFRQLPQPVRAGTHANTAFAMSLAFDALPIAAQGQIAACASDLFGRDKSANPNFEPSAHDFLSPILVEADLMRRTLPSDQFDAWWRQFLPDTRAYDEPASVPDRTDPQFGHLDGLNLSRAWCLRSLGRHLDDSALRLSADRHATAGLSHVSTGNYGGEHWLASFAIYLLTETP